MHVNLCARALDQSLVLGRHGLPLMGTGDWNDGMNRVGEKGQGESVWLGWFLHATLSDFIPLASARGETDRAQLWRAHAAALEASLEREAKGQRTAATTTTPNAPSEPSSPAMADRPHPKA